MTTTAAHAASGPMGWLRRAEAWLDARGKPAWIAAMVLAFIVAWPVGLALLAYLIWGKRMFGKSCHHRHGHSDDRRRAWAESWDRMARTARPSGNAAFDAYKSETLRRLEEEQEAFESFLQRLRDAKDKTEFDSFMEDRARRAQETAGMAEDATAAMAGTTSGGAPAADPTARRGEY